MLGGASPGFELDARLEADSRPVMWLSLCELRQMDDQRWPWFILVPQRAGIEEMHELTPLDQTMLTFELNMVSQALKQATHCTKVNIGALGNIVRQLHVHVIARTVGDAAWPGPVWSHGKREPYLPDERHRMAERIKSALLTMQH